VCANLHDLSQSVWPLANLQDLLSLHGVSQSAVLSPIRLLLYTSMHISVQAPNPEMEFKFGRIDCPTSPNTTASENIPQATLQGHSLTENLTLAKDELLCAFLKAL
jgi:hypothetical protein